MCSRSLVCALENERCLNTLGSCVQLFQRSAHFSTRFIPAFFVYTPPRATSLIIFNQGQELELDWPSPKRNMIHHTVSSALIA